MLEFLRGRFAARPAVKTRDLAQAAAVLEGARGRPWPPDGMRCTVESEDEGLILTGGANGTLARVRLEAAGLGELPRGLFADAGLLKTAAGTASEETAWVPRWEDAGTEDGRRGYRFLVFEDSGRDRSFRFNCGEVPEESGNGAEAGNDPWGGRKASPAFEAGLRANPLHGALRAVRHAGCGESGADGAPGRFVLLHGDRGGISLQGTAPGIVMTANVRGRGLGNMPGGRTGLPAEFRYALEEAVKPAEGTDEARVALALQADGRLDAAVVRAGWTVRITSQAVADPEWPETAVNRITGAFSAGRRTGFDRRKLARTLRAGLPGLARKAGMSGAVAAWCRFSPAAGTAECRYMDADGPAEPADDPGNGPWVRLDPRTLNAALCADADDEEETGCGAEAVLLEREDGGERSVRLEVRGERSTIRSWLEVLPGGTARAAEAAERQEETRR